jgi:hypothetical protein
MNTQPQDQANDRHTEAAHVLLSLGSNKRLRTSSSNDVDPDPPARIYKLRALSKTVSSGREQLALTHCVPHMLNTEPSLLDYAGMVDGLPSWRVNDGDKLYFVAIHAIRQHMYSKTGCSGETDRAATNKLKMLRRYHAEHTRYILFDEEQLLSLKVTHSNVFTHIRNTSTTQTTLVEVHAFQEYAKNHL